ncbi:MAG: helix-turn-helix transcriptional regulator [Bacteroidia bacterium]|nr:helix-turn-helix transcriptional regulator [Bacteroidia bacterium]
MTESEKLAYLIVLGERVKSIRKARKLSQDDLAGKALITTRELAKIEKGETNTTILVLYKLADVLMCEVKDFV